MSREYTPILLSGLAGGAMCAGAVWLTTGSMLGASLGALAAAVGSGGAAAPMLLQRKRAISRLTDALRDVADAPSEAQTVSAPEAPPALVGAINDLLETTGAELERARASIRQLELRGKIAQAEIEATEAVLNSIHDAILVTDSFNELKMANAPAAELMGFDKSEARSRAVDEIVEDPRIRSMISGALSNASPTHRRRVEHTVDDPEAGEPRHYDVTLACLPDAKTEGVGGVVTIIRDITREREISQMKSDFVSKASHELRTPLSSINAYLELLIDGEASDEGSRQEFYGVIKSEADRLGRLIDNMLNISRIEAGIVRATPEEVDFVDVAKSAVEIIQPQAKLKDISVSLQHGPLACTAVADRDMVKQVFLNLLSNAVKYTPEGGRVTVTIENDDSTGSVLSTVADTGLGIPPDDLEKVFDKFYRIDNYKRVAKGTGLGLSLVKQIVETVHHGAVDVSSTLGLGSKFSFTIPYELEGA
jgi:two-component system phosphate regulon sensor histidine kinase PhoR